MPNYDGVFELRLLYSTTPAGLSQMTHRMTFDINADAGTEVGQPFDDILVFPREGISLSLEEWLTATDNFMDKIKACYPATAEFYSAELWRIPEATYDATFISSLELAILGTNGSGSTAAGQTTFTFRSLGGGTARLQLMESSFAGNNRQTPPFTSTANNLTIFFAGVSSIALARDNTPIYGRIAQNDGQNETLFKKRFRNT